MLHWMILLVLLVGNSLAFGIYEDIDDNHLWRRGGPSVHTTASSGEEKMCKKDILVIWDNSISIGETRFKDNVIPFLLGFINSKELKVGEDGTHLGFISFSTKRRTKTILEIGTKNTVEELTAWLMGLKYSDYSGRRTFTGSAFKLANETFSQRSPLNHRPKVEDVILLFTDGAPNARKRKTLNEQIELADKCSKSLMNDKDIKIVSLAVGNWQKFLSDIEKWSSEDSVYTAGLNDLEKVLDKTVKGTCYSPGCGCEGTTEVRSYVGPGEDSVALEWLKPTAVGKNSVDCKLVNETVEKNGSRFSIRKPKKVLNYTFENVEGKQTLCPVIIYVTRCSCPNTKTIRRTVEPGQTTVDVNWKGPEPNCPTTSSTKNSIPVGQYNLTYLYTYDQGERKRFTLQCQLNINISTCACPTTKTIRRTVESDRTSVDVSWAEPTPNCTTSSSNNPGTSGSFPVGEYVRTYKYIINQGLPDSFELQCHVNIAITGCSCSTTQTIRRTVEAGRTTVDVTWEEPTPNCVTTSSSNNPGTSGSFSVGEYVRTYKYIYNQGKPGSFEFQCQVNIAITGYCGKNVYDTAKQECCCGKIRKKIPGYRCCGSRYYNPNTQDCCDESTGIILKYGKCP